MPAENVRKCVDNRHADIEFKCVYSKDCSSMICRYCAHKSDDGKSIMCSMCYMTCMNFADDDDDMDFGGGDSEEVKNFSAGGAIV